MYEWWHCIKWCTHQYGYYTDSLIYGGRKPAYFFEVRIWLLKRFLIN
jgi:hypothetical protein